MWFPSLKKVAIAAAMAVGLGLTTVATGARGRSPVEPEPAPAPATAVAPKPTADPGPASPQPQEPDEGRKNAAKKGQKYAPYVKIADDLVKRAPGPVVRGVPVTRDCMILAYLPDQNVGHVDNLGLANNNGGVRILVGWPNVPADDALAPDHRFLLALYARRTTSHPPAGRIHGFQILEDWREWNSWSHLPRYDPEPFANYSFEPEEGWKLFDVTALVRSQAKDRRAGHGVLLRFLSEDFNGASWSGYDFVSREGSGEWAGRHPVLLIVKDAKAEKAEAR